MSDENQPNEVVESQLKQEGSPVEPMPAVDAPGSDKESTLQPDVAVAPVADVPQPHSAQADAVVEPATASPTVVSIAELEASKPTTGDKVGAFLSGVVAFFQGRRWLIGVVAGLLVLAILAVLIPSLSLAQFSSGYTALTADNLSLEHPDGIKVTLSDPNTKKVRVKLDTVPQADFVSGHLPDDLVPALSALPAILEPKSPYYMVDLRGKDVSGPATVDVVIPNAAEPWETLDLYTWDGEAWQWLPTRLDRDAEKLIADVATLPSSVMVMQAGLPQQKIASETDTSTLPEAEQSPLENVLTEVDVPGLSIGTLGGITGDATQLPAAAQGGALALVPVVRNWVSGRDANWALVSDMLAMDADRTAHVQNLTGVVQSGGYSGLVVDYRELPATDRDAYSLFVRELATALHDNGAWLAVIVDTPQANGNGWDTGGYDWAAIGQAADQLRVEMPLSPQAYVPGGVADRLITWAVTQVNRHKLMPILTTLSTDGEHTLTLDEILAPLPGIQVGETLTESVEPGRALNFKLGMVSSVETDVATGATRITVGETVQWLGTPEWLLTRMGLSSRYHLGGVVVRNLFDQGNLPDVRAAVTAYRAQSAASAFALPEIAWNVTAPDGTTAQSLTPLTQPQFSWTAPAMTGTYKIAAGIGALDKGAIDVVVAVPAPVVTETAVITETEGGGSEATAVEPGGDEETAAAEGLKAGYVADVTVPDNTRFEKEEAFTKTWRMKNSGAEAWPESTVLVFDSGAQMTDVSEVEIGAVEPGDTVDISVDMTAPAEDGTYKGNWQIQVGDVAVDGGKIYLVIQVGEQQAAVPTPATPIVAPVSSGGFELGGHVRDIGLPYKDTMHYAGMNWTKVQVRYGEDAAGIVNIAHANGFKIQLSALGSPGMVTGASFTQDYSAWVANLAKSGADAIEVWNEPNIDREWQIGQISPQAYTNLLCASYNAIKGANSGTAVISAAPAPTGWFGGCGPNGCDDQPWMEGLYAAGAANCMDYIGAHHNAGATSPSARSGHPADPGSTHHSWFFLPQTELYYNIFRGTRKLFYTEMGYASQEGVPTFSDMFAWARGTDNAEQAAWLAEAVQLGINTGMVRCIIVWNIDFVRYDYDPQDGFAIIRPGGGCPACETLHNVLGTR